MELKMGHVGLAVAGLLLSRAAMADDAGVYQFKPGQKLAYHSHNKFEFETEDGEGSFTTEIDHAYYVLNTDNEGAWRVLAHHKTLTTRRYPKYQPPEPAANHDYALMRVNPDGSFEVVAKSGHSFRPIFVQVPVAAEERAKGWENQLEFDEKLLCTLLPDNDTPGTIVFTAVEHSPLHDLYGMDRKSTVTIDTNRGLLTSRKLSSKQTYGFKGEGKGWTKLVASEQMSDMQLDRLIADVEAYQGVAKACDALKYDPGETIDGISIAFDRTRKRLVAVDSQVEHELIKQAIAEQLKQIEENRKYAIDSHKRKADKIGKPSPAWQCEGYDGKTYSNESLKGKVVVLDWWYRGCGWCVRAMPQLKSLSDHYQGKPVVVIGMNVDSDPQDAEFVIDKMGLRYPNVKSNFGMGNKFGVQGYPTMFLIDQKGVVRDIHVGYSADLKDEYIKKIDALLAEPGGDR